MNSGLIKHLLFALVCVLGLAVAAPCSAQGGKEVQWPKTLVISIPVGGGSIQMIAQTFGSVIEQNTPIQRVFVQPMGGPDVWMPRMENGKVDMALNSGPDILNAQYARLNYEGKKPATFVRTLLPGHIMPFAVHAAPASGLKNISDLKGKIVYTKDPGSPMFEQLTNVILATAGLTQADLKASLVRMNTSETAGDLIEGRVDASLSTGNAPLIMEVTQAKGDCITLGLSDEEAKAVKLPEGYFLATVPANSPEFKNPHEMRNAVSFQTNIYCSAKMDPEVAYTIAKVIFDNKDKWQTVLPWAPQWGRTPKPGLPLMHAGAIRYFQERNMWEPETDAWMKSQLERLGVKE